MPKRTYVGSADSVFFEMKGQMITVARGESVDVNDATAAEMDVSAAWSTPTSSTKTPKE